MKNNSKATIIPTEPKYEKYVIRIILTGKRQLKSFGTCLIFILKTCKIKILVRYNEVKGGGGQSKLDWFMLHYWSELVSFSNYKKENLFDYIRNSISLFYQ